MAFSPISARSTAARRPSRSCPRPTRRSKPRRASASRLAPSARRERAETPDTLWTIGHSTRSIGEFVDLLHAHGITRIVDVRRFAGSRAHPHFNPPALERSLARAGITYTPMPGLGGRRAPRPDSPHSAWRNAAFRGYADYMDTPEFAAAAASLARLARRDRAAIMCAEAVWWRCHRSMIADFFKANGWEVLHIMSMADAKEHPYTPVARNVGGSLTY